MKTVRHAVVVTVCAALALAICGSLAAAKSEPGYLKIVTGPDSQVLAQFKDKELRLADGEDGLRKAKTIESKSQRGTRLFKSVAIPAPKDGWPSGIKTVTGDFQLRQYKSRGQTRNILYGTLKVSSKSEDGATWDYLQRVGVQLQSDPKRATALSVLDPTKLALNVKAQKKGKARNIGIALTLTAGNAQLSDIRKDGKPLQAKVQVLDSKGKDIKTTKGYLSNFGFS